MARVASASGSADPVSLWSTSAARASRAPTTSAVSSRYTVVTVGSALSRNSVLTSTPRARACVRRARPATVRLAPSSTEGHEQHPDAHPEVVQLGRVDERPDALPDRHRSADREHADRRQQRPVVALRSVPERMCRVRLARAAPDRHIEEDLVACIRDGVERLGQEGRRAGERGRDALRGRDQGVGSQRREHAPQARVGVHGARWPLNAHSPARSHTATRPSTPSGLSGESRAASPMSRGCGACRSRSAGARRSPRAAACAPPTAGSVSGRRSTSTSDPGEEPPNLSEACVQDVHAPDACAAPAPRCDRQVTTVSPRSCPTQKR